MFFSLATTDVVKESDSKTKDALLRPSSPLSVVPFKRADRGTGIKTWLWNGMPLMTLFTSSTVNKMCIWDQSAGGPPCLYLCIVLTVKIDISTVYFIERFSMGCEQSFCLNSFEGFILREIGRVTAYPLIITTFPIENCSSGREARFKVMGTQHISLCKR